MFGYSATGSCTIATTPTITMRMEITMATMGRLMKKTAMEAYRLLRRHGGGWRARVHPDLLTRAHPIAPFDDDPLVRLEALGDDPERADPLVGLHRAQVDGIVRLHDRDLVNALHVVDGALWDEQRVLPDVHRAHLRVLAGAEHAARIRKDAARQHSAGLHVDLPIEP